jgi:hypothetical protein
VKEHEDRSKRLGVTSGEHQVEFHHRSRTVPGVLELHARQAPRGVAYGLPLPEDGAIRDADGTYTGHGFPTVEHHPTFKATLRSNLPVWLEDVTVEHWMAGQAFVNAAVAIVGWGAGGAHPLFDRLRFQVSGLAQVFGTHPLQRIEAPGLFGGQRIDEVKIGFAENPDLAWTVEEIGVAVRWETAIAGIDPYHFEVKNAPWIEITRPGPAEWQDWLQQWLQPITDLVSLATGDAQQPTIVEVSRQEKGDDQRRRKTAQVFGSGLTQARFYVEHAPHRPPLFRLADLPYPLHELVQRWLDLRQRMPGFADAYLPIVRGAQQTPAANLLLLATAAEAVHIARYGEGPTSPEEHSSRRRAILERIASALAGEDLAFCKRHLSRRDRYNLEQRIAKLASYCPVDLQEPLGLNDLPRRVSSLRNDLAHGRSVAAESLIPLVRGLRGVLNTQLLIELGLGLEKVVEHENWRR